jgi:hypothetical protein
MLDIQFVFSLFHQIKMMYLYSQLTCICILLQLHIYREIPSEGAIIGQNGYSFKPPSCKSGQMQIEMVIYGWLLSWIADLKGLLI